MRFLRRNSITFSNSDIPPAHIAPINHTPAKTSTTKMAPSKLTKPRPPASKDTALATTAITWPLQRSFDSCNPLEMPDRTSPPPGEYQYPYEDTSSSLLQDHWGYSPSISSTASSVIISTHHNPTPPLPPPPSLPHFSQSRTPSLIPTSSEPYQSSYPTLSQHVSTPRNSPPVSPAPKTSVSSSFRSNLYTSTSLQSEYKNIPSSHVPPWSVTVPSQPVCPVSPSSPPDYSRSLASYHSFSRPGLEAITAHSKTDHGHQPRPVLANDCTPVTQLSVLPPREPFPSHSTTHQSSGTNFDKFNPSPPNELARKRSTRLSINLGPGRPRASTQPSPVYHFRDPPASSMNSTSIPTSPSIPPTKLVHRRSISLREPNQPETSSLRVYTRSSSSPSPWIRKRTSASSISIAIDTADDDTISAIEETVEESVPHPSLSISSPSSDGSSRSNPSSRPISPVTPTGATADKLTVTPRPPSPTNSARPTSPTCSVRPASPTQFVITSTPRQSSPAPSTRTLKTAYSIENDGAPLQPSSTVTTSSQDSSGCLSPTTTVTTSAMETSISTTSSRLPAGSMPVFPSRHEAKKARKAYLAEQAEAKRQSAKMGVEGVLGWDARKRAWVCKMSDEEKKAWLEKMTDGKSAVKDSNGSSEWGRGVTIGMKVRRGMEGGPELGGRGLGAKVVDISV